MLSIHPEVADALERGRAVVALESTLIAHGLPWPSNLETACAAESAIRDEGAIPATIVVMQGKPQVGLTRAELELLARGPDILKAARRDLSWAVSQKRTAATTVSATMFLAHLAGIRLFATGGIGGVHRAANRSWDVSADLTELARTPVAVVCAGAKNILDLAKTLELLESLAVPVIGFNTDEFPAFYLRTSGLPVSARVNNEKDVAHLLKTHWVLGGAGVVIAQPLPENSAMDPAEFAKALKQAESLSRENSIRGPALTPFLLARLADITGGKTLRANQELVIANARLAARIAQSVEREYKLDE